MFLSPSCRLGLAVAKLPAAKLARRNASSRRGTRIGCASGFWGDTAVAVPQLMAKGDLDFLVMDYLSEITMSLLAAVRKKLPEMGYVPDFISTASFLKDIKKKGVRVIANAGGINPHACAAALQQALRKHSITDVKIAVVIGDDLMSQIDRIIARSPTDISSGKAFPSNITSMNAYFGAFPIAQALSHGADVVITGRCVDSALVLGPLIHSHKIKATDYCGLAAGSLAGHLIECGAQATGGIFTDWSQVKGWHNIGFPVVECYADGSFALSKPQGTGGHVSVATVSEQLVYEIANPAAYILPDVVCDFRHVTIEKLAGQDDLVLVRGARGLQATDTYKVCATYAEGYRVTAVAGIVGPKAADKGRKTAEAIIKRVNTMLQHLGMNPLSRYEVKVIGAEDSYGPRALLAAAKTREAMLWLAAEHEDKRALEILSREIAPAGTGMAPGLTTIVGGRPKVSPVLKLFSFFHKKNELKAEIFLDGKLVDTYEPAVTGDSVVTSNATQQTISISSEAQSPELALPDASTCYRVEDLAYTRSGDKGNTCNIGVIARSPQIYPYLKKKLTAEVVRDYFGHVFENRPGTVYRYELPGINALNFVLHDSLGGGGISSLRFDPQGKGYGQMLLDLQLDGLPAQLGSSSTY